MRKASRQIVFINTSPPKERVELLKPLSDIQEMEDDCEEIYTGGLLKRYSKLPAKLEDLTLADWAAWYDFNESTLTGYVHLISPVQTSHKNIGVKYFDMALQTSQNESVRLSPLKETLFQGNCTKCKTDVIVADHTNSAKLVLWEDIIDKVDSVMSYRFNDCKIRIFDDHKYINTNEFTKITEIEDIKNVNLLSPQIREHMITAK
ncbi:unnamed protein product [Pocillopora meandrina]|uniref:Uncharacterized protein n=1 Tax=Pocillopora meandrina TaxID=46732 RepID=A0AAU9XS35_9CNID|nr:unnamed protein product [Pocillopora meandrina]